jgi:hypothetical protein
MLPDSAYERIFVVKYSNKFSPGNPWLKETYYSFQSAHDRIAELEKLSYIAEMKWSRSKVKAEAVESTPFALKPNRDL